MEIRRNSSPGYHMSQYSAILRCSCVAVYSAGQGTDQILQLLGITHKPVERSRM